MADVTVVRDDERSRYELRVDGGTLAGFAEFDVRDGKTRFTHTEVDPAFRGRGLGEELAARALADTASRGETIVPLCPFIAKYLEGHDVPGATVEQPRRSGA